MGLVSNSPGVDSSSSQYDVGAMDDVEDSAPSGGTDPDSTTSGADPAPDLTRDSFEAGGAESGGFDPGSDGTTDGASDPNDPTHGQVQLAGLFDFGRHHNAQPATDGEAQGPAAIGGARGRGQAAPAAPADPHVVQNPGETPTGRPVAGQTNAALDGHLTTTQNNGTEYGTGVAAGSIPGANGRKNVMYVNGVQNSPQDAQGSMRNIEQTTGERAVGLYNATDSVRADFWQSHVDRNENTARANGTWTGQSANAATRSLSDSIVNHLNNQQGDLHIMAHSQGGVITANALYDARQRLTQQHGAAEADRMMQRLNVETFGGASQNYPDGPRYTHWINDSDRVTIEPGLGTDPAHGGRGAQFRHFNDRSTWTGHNFNDVYLPNRQRILDQEAHRRAA